MKKIINILLNKNKYTKPYIIAEAGVNHENSMDNCKKMISEVASAGGDAIKFQAYKAENLASINSPAYWDTSLEKTKNQYLLFKKHDKFWKKEFELIHKECQKKNIEFLCTPFDFESATFLNDLVPAFKISSSDINNIPFIEFICDFQKPIIISTGASTKIEIDKIVKLITSKKINFSLLHCVLNYPTLDKDANLLRIKEIMNKYPQATVGYSDHTMPNNMENILYAWLLGASIIEKHYTFDKQLPGNDHYHSMNFSDLKLFINKVDAITNILGDGEINSGNNEKISRLNARRSIILSQDLLKGALITKNDISYKRPGHGISPSETNSVINKKINKNKNKDDILFWEDIENE
tara:strand:+ start:3372 stop:4427 length:1056 start_codon:yes stop_codon:yes gene_type:complete